MLTELFHDSAAAVVVLVLCCSLLCLAVGHHMGRAEAREDVDDLTRRLKVADAVERELRQELEDTRAMHAEGRRTAG